VAALMWLLRAQINGSQLADPFIQQARAALPAADAERAEKLAMMPLVEPVS
jgi:hypothetical protein